MSASIVVVYWRDIPAQVIVRSGRSSAKRELPKRFIESIDRAAMRQGLAASDAYLEQWRRGVPTPCGDDLDHEAERAVQAIDTEYGAETLGRLVANGGWQAPDASHGP